MAYWDSRANDYSSGVCGELNNERCCEWENVLSQASYEIRMKSAKEGRTPRALDLGCGPGFFSILLSRLSFRVDAVDFSASMLERALDNNKRAGTAHCVDFHEGSVDDLPFADETFDLIALRNVTWLMRDPVAAYREWHRVLVPGGKLLVFDANWYRYLVDPSLNTQRLIDEVSSGVVKDSVNGHASEEQEAQCERIALNLPLTHLSRPGWDMEVLRNLGFESIRTDEEIWRRVWTEDEQAFYRSSPLFLIEAVK